MLEIKNFLSEMNFGSNPFPGLGESLIQLENHEKSPLIKKLVKIECQLHE